MPNWRPANIPATPPAAALPDWLVTNVVAGGGTRTLTLASPASNPVSGQAVQHDDTAAIQAAINAAQTNLVGNNASPGALIALPCGQFNLSSTIQVTAGHIGINGNGACSAINVSGGNADFIFSGRSSSSFIFGNFLNNIYEPAYNKYAGWSLQVKFTQNFEYDNVAVDHPYAGISFHDVNDVRINHFRMYSRWGYQTLGFNIESGAGASESTCCFQITDTYENSISTVSGNGGGRLGSTGVLMNGNVATIVSHNWAVSNIEGNGWTINNAVGNPAAPQFILSYGCSTEFSNSRGIDVEAGQEIHFTDCTVHGARNNNHNVLFYTPVKSVSFKGGRVGNAGCNNFDIYANDVEISAVSIFNGSAPNSGGTSGSCHGIVLEPSASDISITGNKIGQQYGVSWQQNCPVFVKRGASNFSIAGNTFVGNILNYVCMNAVGYSATQREEANAGSQVQPSISSGFGTRPSISAGNDGFRAFNLTIGTGGSASSGVITLPRAVNAWSCQATDQTTHSGTVFQTLQSASSTTSVTLTNYNTLGTAAAWNAGDVLYVQCRPM